MASLADLVPLGVVSDSIILTNFARFRLIPCQDRAVEATEQRQIADTRLHDPSGHTLEHQNLLKRFLDRLGGPAARRVDRAEPGHCLTGTIEIESLSPWHAHPTALVAGMAI